MTETQEKRERIKTALEKIYNVPTIPFIIKELGTMLDSEDTSAAQLSSVISKDQGLVTKILTVANSPFYGSVRKISTIDMAIILLGFEQIRNISFALALIEPFNKINSKYFNQREYWVHSFVTGTFTKKLADDLGIPDSGTIFTAGLLHEMGIAVVCKHFPQKYNEIVKRVFEDKVTFEQAENMILGITHQEIAAFLLEKWQLPESLIEPVLYHHYPAAASNHKQAAAVIHISDYITDKLQLGSFFWDSNYNFDFDVINLLNLGSEEYFETFTESYHGILSEQVSSINN